MYLLELFLVLYLDIGISNETMEHCRFSQHGKEQEGGKVRGFHLFDEMIPEIWGPYSTGPILPHCSRQGE